MPRRPAMSLPHHAPSRRAFIGATLLGGSAAVVAACGGGGKKQTETTVSTTQAQGDAAVLNATLELEHTAIAAYEIGVGLLNGKARAAGQEFLAHEREHAAALARAVSDLGTAPFKPRPRADYVAGFPPLHTASQFLTFALDVENTAVAAYLDSLAALNTDPLRSEVASIMTAEAEHMAVILGLLGRPQVPGPFVTGESLS